MDPYNSFDFDDSYSQNDIFAKHSNYNQEYFTNEIEKNGPIFKFGINDPLEENYPFNIIPEGISTDFISKMNNHPEKINEIKDNKKIEESSFSKFKKEKNQNLTGKKTKRDDIEKRNCGRKKKDSDEKGTIQKMMMII